MPHSFEFRIVRYEPDSRRGERVNIGLLVVNNGNVEVHLAKNLSKVTALTPQVRLHSSLSVELADMFSDLWSERRSFQSSLKLDSFSLSEAGTFICERDQLHTHVENAMKRLVLPARRLSVREGKTRLHTEIKRQFRSDGVLGTSPDDISNHKVVAGFEFPGDEELSADFAFKNGKWHLTQVLDYRVTSPHAALKKIKEVSLKAIALDLASKDTDRLLGDDKDVVKNVVVWIPEELEETVAPQVDILGGYANLFRFNKTREQVQYWDMMGQLTRQWVPQE